jgi:hypothetical protein
MRIVSPYRQPQRWLKGNLHTHTTLSDGKATPDEILRMYREDGYDFLAITDHDRFSGPPPDEFEGMLLLPGQECHVASENGGFDYHVVSLGDTGDIPRLDGAQAIVDEIRARGAMAILCHPRWSFMPYELFDQVEGCTAFEVYNGTCEKAVGRGFSNEYWDRYMTAFKRPLWAVAVDDTHRPERDFAMGWTFVNAEKTAAGIFDALQRGDAYSSTGPRVETIRVDDSTITLHTSSAKAVKFVSTDGRVIASAEGEHVKVASYQPGGDELYIRAEVHGHDGRIAWTNPFFIEP